MKIAGRLLLAMLLVAASAAASLGADLAQAVRTLEEGYATLNDLHADFSQRTTVQALKREEKGGGELFIKKGAARDAMFRFNYTKPRQQIISNGKKVWYYLPDEKQVMVMDVTQLFQEGNVALNYLAGMGHISKDFNIAFAVPARDGKGNYVLELTPKKKSTALARLQLVLAASAVEKFAATGQASTPFPIVASSVFDQAGTATRIDYSKVRTNRGVDSGKFTFRIPAGVEVVNGR